MWLDTALEAAGIGKFHMLQMLLMSSLWMYGGGQMLLLSSVTSAMEKPWGISPAFKAWAASSMMAGMLIGGLVGGAYADAIGRRPVFLVCLGGMALFGTLAALAPGPLAFSLCHVMVQTFVGAGSGPCMSLAAETAPQGWRNQLLNSLTVPFVSGEVYLCALMLIFMPSMSDDGQDGWRKVAFGWASPAVAGFVCSLVYLDESPYFLEAAGRLEEAVDAARRIATWNGCEHPGPDCLQGAEDASSDGDQHPDQRAAYDTGDEVSSSSARACGDPAPGLASGSAQTRLDSGVALSEVVGESSVLSQCMEIFTPDLRGRVFVGSYLCFVADFLSYGSEFFLPLVFKHLEEDRHRGFSPIAMTLIACIFGYLSLFVGMASLAQFGVPRSLVVLAIATACLQAGMGTISSGEEYVSFAVSATCLSKPVGLTFGNLVYVYIAVIFPSGCRCTGVAFCIAVGHVGAALAPLTFSALDQLTGGPAAYMLLAGCLTAAAALVASWGPETDRTPAAGGAKDVARVAAKIGSSSFGTFAEVPPARDVAAGSGAV